MDAIWIVTANAGRARFFSQASSTAPLEEVNDMVNAAARLRTAEIASDELGQHAASKSRHKVGAPRPPNGYQPEQTPLEHQAALFARSVADFLLQSQRENRFGQWMLAASPEFLGQLRKLLDPHLKSAMNLEINKDLTQLTASHLREQIQVLKKKQSA